MPVEEDQVIEYLGHLNELNIRNDITTREAKKKRNLNEELKYPTGTTSGVSSLKITKMEG